MNASAPHTAQLERCPHCRSDAPLDPHPDLRFKCRACGRPRIPLTPADPTPPGVAALLKQAGAARMAKFGWKTGGWGLIALGFCTGLASLLVGWLIDAQLTSATVLGLLTLAPVLLSVFAFRASKAAGAKSVAQLDAAWQEAVSDLYRARGGALDAHSLAQALGIPPEDAAQLLAEAEVAQFLNPDVNLPPRVRVGVGPTGGEDTELQRAAEQELAEALGQADTEAFEAASFEDPSSKRRS